MPAGPAEVATWRQPREPHNGPSGARARSKKRSPSGSPSRPSGLAEPGGCLVLRPAGGTSLAALRMGRVLPFALALRRAWVLSFPLALPYLHLPNPNFLSVLNIDLNMEFIGTRQKSRFW